MMRWMRPGAPGSVHGVHCLAKIIGARTTTLAFVDGRKANRRGSWPKGRWTKLTYSCQSVCLKRLTPAEPTCGHSELNFMPGRAFCADAALSNCSGCPHS